MASPAPRQIRGCCHSIVRTVAFQCQARVHFRPRVAGTAIPPRSRRSALTTLATLRRSPVAAPHMLRPGARMAPKAQTRLVPPALAGPVDRAVRSLFGVSWGKARAWIEGGQGTGRRRARDRGDRARGRRGRRRGRRARRRKPRRRSSTTATSCTSTRRSSWSTSRPGLSTVPTTRTEIDTLDARVRAWLSGKRQRALAGQRPTLGIVHRLDKETSGLVVFTRTWLAKQASPRSSASTPCTGATSPSPTATCRSRTVRTSSSRTAATACAAARAARRRNRRRRREAITHVERLEAARRGDARGVPARDGTHPPDPHPPERIGQPARRRARLRARATPGRSSRRRA